MALTLTERNAMSFGKPFPPPSSLPEGRRQGFAWDTHGAVAASAWPDAKALVAHGAALGVLQAVMTGLQQWLAGEPAVPVDLRSLHDADRALVTQVLGDGEVVAQCVPDPASADDVSMQAQETAFAGVWRVRHVQHSQCVLDTIELGDFPQAMAQSACDGAHPMSPQPTVWPAGTANAPAVLQELHERAQRWAQALAAGGPRPAHHVTNLTLQPLSPTDRRVLDEHLGQGSIQVLSRGHGNCRVSPTKTAHVWRVTYFNARDMVILDTFEVGGVPEVACAARQDLQDSAHRLSDLLQWVELA